MAILFQMLVPAPKTVCARMSLIISPIHESSHDATTCSSAPPTKKRRPHSAVLPSINYSSAASCADTQGKGRAVSSSDTTSSDHLLASLPMGMVKVCHLL